MRGKDDIKLIRFEAGGTISLDLERIEEDPLWGQILQRQDISTDQGLNAALCRYFVQYLSNESILAEMPSTNGPATLTGLNAEVVAITDPLTLQFLKSLD